MPTGLDILLITIYLISISLVLEQMRSSLFIDQVEIAFNGDDFRSQLESQLLQEVLDINFSLATRYDRDSLPSEIKITIKNISNDKWVYVEWDYSSLIDVDREAKRLVRVPPGSTFDLLPSQMFTVISPNTQLTETLTSETTLKRDADAKTLKAESALINLSKLNKNQNIRLEKLLKTPVTFYVRLALRVGDKSQKDDRTKQFCTLNGGFTVKAVHWKQQLPWNMRKK